MTSSVFGLLLSVELPRWQFRNGRGHFPFFMAASYDIGPEHRVVGIPFVAAIFERTV